MTRISDRRRGFPIATFVLAAVLPAQSPESVVGSLADWRNARWEGLEFWSPDDVVRFLHAWPDADVVLHPRSPREPFRAFVRTRLEEAYRYAGFESARVVTEVTASDHLRVEVTEGERLVAGELLISGNEASVAIVRASLESQAAKSRPDSPWWQVGGPAHVGAAALREAERRARTALADAGRRAKVTAGFRHEDDGACALTVSIDGDVPVIVQSVRFSGDEETDAGEILRRVEFEPRVLCTAAWREEFRRRLLELCRYRDVELGIGSVPESGVFDPLEVELSLLPGAGPLTAAPKDELATLRRAADRVLDALTSTHLLEITRSPEGDSDHGRILLRLGPTGLLFQFEHPRLGPIRFPSMVVSLERDRVAARSTWFDLSTTVNDDAGPALVATLQLLPDTSGDDPDEVSLSWGVAASTATYRSATARAPRHLGPIGLWTRLHPAAMARILRRYPWEIDAAAGAVGLEVEDAEIRVDLSENAFHADVRHVAGDYLTSARLAPAGDGFEDPFEAIVVADDPAAALVAVLAPVLGSEATEVPDALASIRLLQPLAIALGRHLDPTRSGEAPELPETEAGGADNPIAAVQRIQRSVRAIAAGRFEFRSWPDVFARELPCLFGCEPGRWPLAAAEIQYAAGSPDSGPLAMLVLAASMRVAGDANYARQVARRGLARSTEETFRGDVDTLLVALGPELRGSVADAWRALAADAAWESNRAFPQDPADDEAVLAWGIGVLHDGVGGPLLDRALRALAAD